MKTDFAKEILIIARRILTAYAEGRVYSPETLAWAKFITETNK